MTKRILVTGGLGFIGSHLVRELRARGHLVWTLDLRESADHRHFRADVAQFQQLSQAFEGSAFELVYHLAAEYGRRNGEERYENVWTTNVIGTKHVLRLQERHRFRLVFFSSCEVYGDYHDLITEDLPERLALRQTNDYAVSKWVGELQVLNSAQNFGTESVRVRPLNCYGPLELPAPHRGVVPNFVYNALHGRPLPVCRGHLRIFDYVEDTARTLANIAERFKPGEVYNIGGRLEWLVDIRTLAEAVLRHAGREDLPIIEQESDATTARVKRVDCSKARRDLGHDPRVSLEEGLRRTVAWMRDALALGRGIAGAAG